MDALDGGGLRTKNIGAALVVFGGVIGFLRLELSER